MKRILSTILVLLFVLSISTVAFASSSNCYGGNGYLFFNSGNLFGGNSFSQMDQLINALRKGLGSRGNSSCTDGYFCPNGDNCAGGYFCPNGNACPNYSGCAPSATPGATTPPVSTPQPPASTPQPPVTTPPTTEPGEQDSTLEAYAAQVVALVNQERKSAGLSELTVDTGAKAAAQLRAKEIVTLFSHTRPNGSSCFTALNESNVSYRGAGENIASGYASAEKVMQGWMNSQGHRENILNGSFTKIGVGCYEQNGRLYWTQFFIY